MNVLKKGLNLFKPTHVIAYGFGSGLSRFAPGTAGTIVAFAIWYVALQHLPPEWFGIIIYLSFIMGLHVCDFTAKDLGEEDPGGIVWDEFVGMWLVLSFLPEGSLSTLALIGFSVPLVPALLGFVLFRIFDAGKLGPVGWADRRFKGGFGIMFDDVVAAILAIASLHLLLYLW
jgi:phosphatidylglycerophosphatase A